MIITADDSGRNALADGSVALAQPLLPTELTVLARWGCWRSRTKKCQDRYRDGTRTAERVVFEALHPTTGRALSSSRPEGWVGFDLAMHPQARKPFEGLVFLVREEDRLAALRHAQPDVLDRLGDNAVHAEQEVDGDGLVVIVRASVVGAKTNVFVPLSGREPYQEPETTLHPDGIVSLSGRNSDGNLLFGRSPYQRKAPVRTEPVPEEGSCQDGSRTIFSYSLKNHYLNDDPDQIRTEVDEYARVVCEQGKAEDSSKWVYGLIGVFKRHKLNVQDIPQHLLLIFATTIGEDVGAVQRRVLAGWSSWKANKVPLRDALLAVQTDPSLLNDISSVLADRSTLLAAGMCKYMGADGLPFALSGRVLAEVLGLRGQQEGSEVVRALIALKLIRRVSEGMYADKLAAEYVWVRAEIESVPAPQPVEPPSPAESASNRPGHSHEQTETCRFPSKLGGFLTDEHYLAEVMLARKLGRQGRELFDGFWTKADLGPEYGRQVVAARSLLKSYSVTAVCRAIRSKDGDWAYSLAAPQLVDVVKSEQARLERQQEAFISSPVPPPDMPKSELPRPCFSSKPTTFQKLRSL